MNCNVAGHLQKFLAYTIFMWTMSENKARFLLWQRQILAELTWTITLSNKNPKIIRKAVSVSGGPDEEKVNILSTHKSFPEYWKSQGEVFLNIKYRKCYFYMYSQQYFKLSSLPTLKVSETCIHLSPHWLFTFWRM